MRSRAAIRYSKAIFQIAEESNSLSNIKGDMDSIISAHESSEDFKKLINNTLINYSDKKEILSIVISKMNEKTNNLIDLLIANKRLSILYDIAHGFNDIYNQENNIARATVVTATPISDKIKNQVLKKIQTLSNKSVEIENIIDETIIGGFILRYENREYNASLSQRLNKLKTKLIQ
jgi:F-type H+-transporting ATPase subunit delta|tara:strand:+ start:4829 stop:5359 length:531 start_codon:yes stop_codon:yes gene_type:complete